MGKTFFVAGATGYTGRGVVDAAVSAGHRTLAHVRPGSSAAAALCPAWEAAGVEVVSCPWEMAKMRSALQAAAPHVVFSLLGTTRRRAAGEGMGAQEAYESVDYGLSVLLLTAAAELPSLPRFVYLSALGADAGSNNAYVQVRGRVEAMVRSSGLPFTIAQPSFITGADREESRPMERAAAVVADGMLGLVGALGARTLRDRFGSMTGAQLGQALVGAAVDPESENRVLRADDLRRYLPR